MTFRAGIVGCGRIGSEFDDDPKRKYVASHCGAYKLVGEAELVAICDINPEKLEKCGKRWGISSRYQNYEEMLAREQIDILSICTPPSSHFEILKEAVSEGVKAVFCEKPISSSLQEADEMIRLCQKEGVILQIDHQRRFDRFIQEVREFIREGKLGDIQQITFYYTAGIANTGSHLFDLLRFFFGEVEWVRGVYSRNLSPNPDDLNIDGFLKFRDGPFCSVQACDVRAYLVFEMNTLGTLGRLNLTRSGFDVEFYEVKESELFSGYNELFRAPSPIAKDTPKDFMVNGVRHLVECLREKRKSISSGEDGKAALEIIYAFTESANRDGEIVELPLKSYS